MIINRSLTFRPTLLVISLADISESSFIHNNATLMVSANIVCRVSPLRSTVTRGVCRILEGH